MSDHHGHTECGGCRATDRLRRRLDRRLFLRAGGMSVASFGFAPGFLARALAASSGASGRNKVLVCVFQRGAVDGLNMVVPHADRDYYRARPRIAVPEPGRGSGRALDLDGFFGLHPALDRLEPWFASGNLAVVHAVGSPDATRSHFDAQDYMETGTPGIKSTTEGWLNRLAQSRGIEADALTRAIATTGQLPLSMAGPAGALAVGDLEAFLGTRASGDRAPVAARSEAVAEGLRVLYGRDGRDIVVETGAGALGAVDLLRAARPLGYRPRAGVTYPRGDLGRQLRQIAQLIKADVGLEIAFADMGGWDTHVNQGGAEGQLAQRLGEFGGALAAFADDLEDRLDDVVLLTMSEFGRTVEENGNAGTDHGHANVSLVMGGGVEGGRVYGAWPGLDRDRRYEGRDLALTTDFRDLFAEVAVGHLAPASPETLFPGHPLDPGRFHGLFAR